MRVGFRLDGVHPRLRCTCSLTRARLSVHVELYSRAQWLYSAPIAGPRAQSQSARIRIQASADGDAALFLVLTSYQCATRRFRTDYKVRSMPRLCTRKWRRSPLEKTLFSRQLRVDLFASRSTTTFLAAATARSFDDDSFLVRATTFCLAQGDAA